MAIIKCENCGQELITRQEHCPYWESDSKSQTTRTKNKNYKLRFMAIVSAIALIVIVLLLSPLYYESLPTALQKIILTRKIERYEAELESCGVKIRENEDYIGRFSDVASSPESLSLEYKEHRSKQNTLREKIENAKAGLAAAKRKLRKLEGNN